MVYITIACNNAFLVLHISDEEEAWFILNRLQSPFGVWPVPWILVVGNIVSFITSYNASAMFSIDNIIGGWSCGHIIDIMSCMDMQSSCMQSKPCELRPIYIVGLPVLMAHKILSLDFFLYDYICGWWEQQLTDGNFNESWSLTSLIYSSNESHSQKLTWASPMFAKIRHRYSYISCCSV